MKGDSLRQNTLQRIALYPLPGYSSDFRSALLTKSLTTTGSYRGVGELYVLFIECRRIASYDNPAKQSVSPCNKPTHDKGAKFLHYCG
jgi:hypothetical protein